MGDTEKIGTLTHESRRRLRRDRGPGPIDTRQGRGIDPMTAASMTPGWYAERTPDVPAIIMGSNGETVTYAQLEERSVRFARALRSLGLRVGDHIAILMENNSSLSGGGLGGAAVRAVLHGDKQPSACRRGAVHPRRLRRRRPGDVRGHGRGRGGTRPVAHRRQGLGGRGSARLRPLRRAAGQCDRRSAASTSARAGRCCTRRARPGGPRGCASSCRGTPLGRPHVGSGADRAGASYAHGGAADVGVPVAGAALPRGAARLVDVDVTGWAGRLS